MAVITISRQYGSGGDDVAARVCERLGYTFFDKRVIARMASDLGLSESNVIDFSEEQYQARSLFDRFRGPRVVAQTRSWREDVSGRRVPTVENLDEVQAVRMVRSAVQRAHEEGNIVILGRGGQAILKDEPGVLHVRIEAPEEARVQRLQEEEGLSPEEARKLIGERDKAAADYVRNFYDIDWSDAMHYHLVINTGKWDTEAAAHLIVSAVNYLPTAQAVD